VIRSPPGRPRPARPPAAAPASSSAARPAGSPSHESSGPASHESRVDDRDTDPEPQAGGTGGRGLGESVTRTARVAADETVTRRERRAPGTRPRRGLGIRVRRPRRVRVRCHHDDCHHDGHRVTPSRSPAGSRLARRRPGNASLSRRSDAIDSVCHAAAAAAAGAPEPQSAAGRRRLSLARTPTVTRRSQVQATVAATLLPASRSQPPAGPGAPGCRGPAYYRDSVLA
jgi:hypothetical protein